MARLSAFLPQMKSANEELEKNIAEGKGEDLVLDSVGDGKDYIEMVRSGFLAPPPPRKIEFLLTAL